MAAGLFFGFWSRLHAAASGWRRRGEPASGDDGDEGEEEATVRARLVRRAAAARRVGRKLAFVSFNLEVLVFVYAFWRARRRSLSWRQPIQALPMLVIPALATLIYAAFVRFTRMFDLKDKKTLERLEEEKQKVDGERREFDQNDRSNVQNCDDVDDASNSLVATDSMAQTSKLRKRRQSSINLRGDGGADMAWGHSKDFQPTPSDGLRQRRFSSVKTYMTKSSATENSEEKTHKSPSVSVHSNQHSHVPISTEDTVSYPFDNSHHSRPVISSMLAKPANNHQELPAGDGEEEGFDGLWNIVDTRSSSRKEIPISPVGSHNSFCDRDDSRLSEHGISSLSTVLQELLVKVNEEHSLSLQEKLEFSPVFVKEAPASPSDDFVAHSSLNDLSPNLSDLVLPASETFKKLPAEGVKEEALFEPHKSAALQMYSFTSEEIPTSCAVDDKGLIITSDVETYPLPSICSNVRRNAAIVNIDTVSPELNFLPELLGEGVEETESSKFHIPEESMIPFNSDEEVLVCPLALNNIEHCSGTPDFSLCSQEIVKMEVAGSVSFIKAGPELSFLCSPELVVEGGEDDLEKELCELNTKEENATLINMEEEALQDPLVVSTSTSEQCLETSEVSLCIQDAKMTEVPGIINFVTASPELNYPASPELLAEGGEDFKEDTTPNLHLPEQNGLPFDFEKEPILDSLVAVTTENSLVTSEFLLSCEKVEMTEVHEVLKEGFFESDDEGAFNHRKLIVASSDDDRNTQNLISNSMYVQFIPDADIKEALQGGQEAFSEPLHQSTCHSEGMFLSSGEINNDEAYSSNSNLYFSYASVVKDEAPLAGQEGLSKFEDETANTFLDTPIFLDEVTSAAIVDIDTVSPKLNLLPELLGEGVEENELSRFHVPEENRTPFNLEEVSVCPLVVNNIKNCVGTPEFSLCSQETEEMEVAGNASFIKVSPELSFLSSPKLAAEGGEDAREKETCKLNTKEENDTLINLEDEALQGALVVGTTEQCLETSEFSLCSQDAKTMEVPGVVNYVTVSPELNCATSPELLAEGNEDSKEDATSDLHLHQQKGLPFNLEKEPFLDPLVVDTAEDSLVTSEFLLCSEEVNMTEVHGAVEEVLSESEDEGAFNHRKLFVTSSDNHSNTQNLRSNSMSAQFIPDANVKEALHGGQEALSEPPNGSTCHSEGIFLSSGEINNDEVEVEAPFAGQGGLSKSEDKMAFTFLDTPVLLDEVRSAENLADNSGSSQAPSETSQEVTFCLEESLVSSDEGINSEIFSLYSRSSSCVSEVNMTGTLRDGTSSEPENDRDVSSDERNPVIFHNMNSTENYTNNPTTAEFILETNMMETAGSLPEVSSNYLGTFVAPDVSNGIGQSDKHLNLLSSSFAPVVGAFEPLQTGQRFSELQCENDFTFQETKMSPKEITNAENYLTNTIGDPQCGQKTPIVALQAAQHGLSESRDEDVFTLHRTYMSPEDISNAENSLAADYASGLPDTVESHCFSEKAKPKSQDPLSFEEILVYPDEGSKAEKDLGNAKSSLCSTEVNLTEPLDIDFEGTPQQQDETFLGLEDIYVARQEATSENHSNNSGSQDAITAETLQGAEILSSEILYNGIFSFEGTLISLDGDSDAENFSNYSGSVMHTSQINTTSLLGLQEGSFRPKDEKTINSISPYEINSEETNSSNRGNSSSASSRHDIGFVEAPQELPIDAGSEKVSPKDKEPNDIEFGDKKEDVEDLDDGHENNPIDPPGVDDITTSLAPNPSVELYAKNSSWRDSAMGINNDFEVARVAGLQQRKPVFTISNSTGSGTVSELADLHYTEPLSAHLPSSVATDTQSRSNDMTARAAVEWPTTEQPLKSI